MSLFVILHPYTEYVLFFSSLKPDLLDKLGSLVAIHGPLPLKPLRTHLAPGAVGVRITIICLN